jgi:hypothetical protein
MACRWVFFRYAVLVACLACIGISSCSTTPAPTKETKYQEFWPAPPELARYRYIMSIFSSDGVVLKSEAEQFQEFLVGKKKPSYQLLRPLDIAVRQGRIYLIDSGSFRENCHGLSVSASMKRAWSMWPTGVETVLSYTTHLVYM